ncbi:MAG: pyridoxamine 5'-phosphate oxidase family protein [Atopobiaceae bacterium]
MLNENVVKVLNESMWDLATCADGKPNVVPVAFKEIDKDGNLHIGDVFLETTLANLKADGGRIALSAYNPKTLEGYQIKGQATYTTEGEYVEKFKKMVEDMFKGAATAKGALTIVPDEVIVTTPGAENKKVLD